MATRLRGRAKPLVQTGSLHTRVREVTMTAVFPLLTRFPLSARPRAPSSMPLEAGVFRSVVDLHAAVNRNLDEARP